MMQNLTLSITQLNNYIKQIFDNEEFLYGISVYGEVTNFKISNSIAYFDLKEEGAQLSCVKFSCFAPFAKNGDKVVVTGRLNYHVKLGKLSFVVSKVEMYGMGELYKKFLELKARLESQGIFDESRKKKIPTHANTIGIVTSETGAVIRDIYHVTRKKNPYTNILVYPSRVQGAGAEKEIVGGIEYFNKAKNVDVIIVARGGGSFEDLSPFNTEEVAMAAFKSELPIISAIGHETDFSILDFASDLRAPTPSVAAELAVFDYYQELEYVTAVKDKISSLAVDLIDEKKNAIGTAINSIIGNVNLLLKDASAKVKLLTQNIISRVDTRVGKEKSKLDVLVAKIEKSNPLTILKQGYAKVLKNGESVKIKKLKVGDEIETLLEDGVIISQVKSLKEKKL